MPRPQIITRCVADNYHAPDERIAEIVMPDGRGCLISVRNDGSIVLYRSDRPFATTTHKAPDLTGDISIYAKIPEA